MAAKIELGKIKGELGAVTESLRDVRKSEAKRAIAESASPKLVPGDRPGEVAIVGATMSPEEIEDAQKKAEEAIDKGEEPPPAPKSGTAKIPVQLRPGQVQAPGLD